MSASVRPRLLIVDDEAICRRAVADLAEALGLSCDCAADGLSGLALARQQRYDLLLIDWRMPGLTGSELMEALRSDPSAASARSTMVLVTGEAIDFDRERARGFDAVLAKPLTPAQLGALLGQAPLPAAAGAYAAPLPLLDDAAALAALGGNRELLDSLRQMLAAELHVDLARLPVQLAEGAVAAMRERLHQLTGGARYCGASALAEAADQLRQTLKAGLPGLPVWPHFEQTVRATLAALDRGSRS